MIAPVKSIPTDAEAILQVCDLTSGYADQVVLRDVSIQCKSNQVIAIVGPNGHGKSTLLKSISGLCTIVKGKISIAGIDATKLPPHQIVGLGAIQVPQGDLVFGSMSVEENLLMGAYHSNAYAQRHHRRDEAYTLMPKLYERRKQLASSLSGGERRMLGIGRALMANHNVLLLDEPSLGLAPKIIEQIYQLIASLRDAGTSIVLVEENVSRAKSVSDYIYLVDNGKVAWHGDASENTQQEEMLQTYFGVS